MSSHARNSHARAKNQPILAVSEEKRQAQPPRCHAPASAVTASKPPLRPACLRDLVPLGHNVQSGKLSVFATERRCLQWFSGSAGKTVPVLTRFVRP